MTFPYATVVRRGYSPSNRTLQLVIQVKSEVGEVPQLDMLFLPFSKVISGRLRYCLPPVSGISGKGQFTGATFQRKQLLLPRTYTMLMVPQTPAELHRFIKSHLGNASSMWRRGGGVGTMGVRRADFKRRLKSLDWHHATEIDSHVIPARTACASWA